MSKSAARSAQGPTSPHPKLKSAVRKDFPPKLLDPAIIKEPGIVDRINRFVAGTRISDVAPAYPCETQRKAQPHQLYLGWDGKVNIWQGASVVNFAAYADGYPTSEHAVYAAYRLYYAAQNWNALNLGVTFNWVGKLEDAAFVLAYGGDGGSTLARAFFPNTNDLNAVFVYKRAFDPDSVNYQTNIFTHELGHVLGLRHEFAPQEGGAVLFGPTNPRSVMSYTFPPQIQDTDKTSTQALYSTKLTSIGGFPVVRVAPDN